jgi:signal transduction histidine kinase
VIPQVHQATVPDARTSPARLAAVQATGLLDSEIEEVFDRLTRLAVRLVRVPASFISLVDEDRDFYKSACGFGEPLASAREMSGPTFCHYTVARSTPLVIPDTAADPVYREVPTVKSLGVAAYVGVPLIVSGQTIGAFCTIDVNPRQWTTDEVEVLVELAASVQREIELRGALAANDRQRSELETSNQQLQEQAVELEMQAEELHATAAHLEDRTEAAEAANESKARFLSMMSHELRTPLNAIGGYAELLTMGMRGPVTPEQVDYLARIQRAGRHLKSLIGEILEFTRLDAGQVAFDLTEFPVSEAIRDAAELVAPTIAERQVEFDHETSACAEEGDRGLVRADAARLRQILVNLLANAVKFTPRGGRVWITCSTSDSQVKIGVSDTGRGIASEEINRVFEPFVQIDRSSTEVQHQGVGLGLAISRELARGMSGDLSVVSEPGAGSTFTVTLPRARRYRG